MVHLFILKAYIVYIAWNSEGLQQSAWFHLFAALGNQPKPSLWKGFLAEKANKLKMRGYTEHQTSWTTALVNQIG